MTTPTHNRISGVLEDESGAAPHVAVDAEIAGLIPPLRDDEKALLDESLRRDGCLSPLLIWEETGVLLDGHNRYEICTRNEIEFPIKKLSFPTRDDAILWVIENQLGRRNLADIDRIALAARREHVVRDRVAKSQGARTDLPQNSAEGSQPLETRVLSADAAGVSHDTYSKGKFILQRGVPALVQAVRDGEASIHSAAVIAELPRDEQVAAIANGNIIETAKAARGRRSQNTGNNEWGTPRAYLDAVRQVLGTIDVDPATHAAAQTRVQATTFHTIEDDGLSKPWLGTVFLNPPYSKTLIRRFVQKLVDEFTVGNVTAAILLVNNETDAAWFQLAASHASHICFPKGRVRFLRSNGQPSRNSALQGQAVLYFGPNGDRFCEVFAGHGVLALARIAPALEHQHHLAAHGLARQVPQ